MVAKTRNIQQMIDASATSSDMTVPERCPACGLAGVSRRRVRSRQIAPTIEALTCPECGEWWFEAGGNRITLETIVRLGLGT